MTTKETLCTLAERLTALVRDWEKARQEGDDDRKLDLDAEIVRVTKMHGRSAGMADKSNVRFVQFHHRGEEHEPDEGKEWKSWNPTTAEHARKFLQVPGMWVEEESGSSCCKGDVWAWAEWEPESRQLRRFEHSRAGKPRYLWAPAWVPPSRPYRCLQNTDPFIFGGFYYTNCGQEEKGLRQLDKGSVIMFGSKKDGRWVVDTVFVVADHVDITARNNKELLKKYKNLLEDRVPACYWDVVLSPTFENPCCKDENRVAGTIERRLYMGATHGQVDGHDPVDGMFSFFPCLPASKKRPFARPHIELPKAFFTWNLSQGRKGYAWDAKPLSQSTVKELWHSIVEQVRKQGLLLGVAATPPEPSSR